ncbi:mannan endo-1,6-alpha-mannosidase [Delitschia confertaspora ATCC 74209]|uniref:Mannan endo-1,6-alpha-mannosidase n=1 Tax=Delitschia confertaspora ATCC 74209 TaxID=1513339 RepID=A0A9P4JNS9_9PLEO|nr:mannan endo-1,6-alpha-mannosidase [Delitschia confertaspora ATCC 74209]
MFLPKSFLSLALPLFIRAVRGLDLDVNTEDSIKSTAKTLAGAIVAAYNDYLQPGEVPGLFSEAGAPYYWWQAGTTWNALIEYSYLTGDSQYDELVSNAITFQLGKGNSFMVTNQTKNLGNDDQSTWGLAALTAAEVGFKNPREGKWIDFAKNVFNNQVLRWDDKTCGGGLRWQIFSFNKGYEYKNTLTSSNFFLLSARLAHLTGNMTYAEWADKSFKWSQDVGLLTKDYKVYDGTDAQGNCTMTNKIQWTAPHGSYTEGAAFMYNLTNGDNKWKDAVNGLVTSGAVFWKGNNILTEVACEPKQTCNVDQSAFKGIAARSYARASVVAPIASVPLRKVLETSAKGAGSNCNGEGKDLSCTHEWQPEAAQGKHTIVSGKLGEVFAALEVVQGLLYPKASIVAKGTTPTGSSNPSSTLSSSGTVSASGTPSGSVVPAQGTGTAGRNVIAWGGVTVGAMVAMLGS